MRRILALPVAASLLAASARAQCPGPLEKMTNERQYDAARAEVDRQLKKNPKDDVALHCMGWNYEQEGKSDKAVDWFEKAVAANDKNADHHLWLGHAVGEGGKQA